MPLGVKLLSIGIAGSRSKTGRTERSTLIDTVQVVAVPVQSGVVVRSASASTDHPTKVEPAAGDAVSVTETLPKASSQSAPQLIPAGTDVMVPEPSPVPRTFRFAASAEPESRNAIIRAIIRKVAMPDADIP